LPAQWRFLRGQQFRQMGCWVMYPRTLARLLPCYDAGLPFFRRALEGDLLFTSAMFDMAVLLNVLAGRLQRFSDRTDAA
jgi:hypothetical protein